MVQNQEYSEVKEEPIDNGYGSFQHSQVPSIISTDDRSKIEKIEKMLSKKQEQLHKEKKRLSQWQMKGEEWMESADKWWISNNIGNVTEDNKEVWIEKQKYLKHKNTLAEKTAEYKKNIADLELQIEQLKKSMSF